MNNSRSLKKRLYVERKVNRITDEREKERKRENIERERKEYKEKEIDITRGRWSISLKHCFKMSRNTIPTSVLVKWCRVGQSGINSAREGLRDPLFYKTTKIIDDHRSDSLHGYYTYSFFFFFFYTLRLMAGKSQAQETQNSLLL